MPVFKRAVRGKWLGQPATAQNVAPATAGLPGPFALEHAILQNRSASAAAAALVGLLPDSMWEAGQWVNATSTYTADTLDAQDGDTNDFPLETLTVNDGFIVGCDVPFGALSVDVTTASVGAGVVRTVEYWNGSAWVVIAAVGTLSDIPRTAGTQWALGEHLVLFDPPVDWQKGGSGTNVNQNRYNLRVRVTTVGTTAGVARRIYVGETYFSVDGLAANGATERYPMSFVVPNFVLGVSGAFSVADEGNGLEVFWGARLG